ncbi:MAG: SpoIIE family protein phosphatase [Verrucomicrobiota bacterium]
MNATLAQRSQALDWAVASRPQPGQSVSGDLHFVTTWDGGALAAAIDGLGHGEEAALAARRAAETLEAHAQEPLTAILRHCHSALRDTRGVAMTLVALDAGAGHLSVLGVGNVETAIFKLNGRGPVKCESVMLRCGVVGYQLPSLQPDSITVWPGDVVVFATDGVREDFADLVNPTDPLQQLVDNIMARKFRGTDDGLVLACKYTGRT